MDVFLFAQVMMIFAYGILYLFIIEDVDKERLSFPSWLQIKSIFQLKIILGKSLSSSSLCIFLRRRQISAIPI